MLLKIHICGDRRTLRAGVKREASFMVDFLLTGLVTLPGYFVYPKIMPKVFYLFSEKASVGHSPLPNLCPPKVMVNFL